MPKNIEVVVLLLTTHGVIRVKEQAILDYAVPTFVIPNYIDNLTYIPATSIESCAVNYGSSDVNNQLNKRLRKLADDNDLTVNNVMNAVKKAANLDTTGALTGRFTPAKDEALKSVRGIEQARMDYQTDRDAQLYTLDYDAGKKYKELKLSGNSEMHQKHYEIYLRDSYDRNTGKYIGDEFDNRILMYTDAKDGTEMMTNTGKGVANPPPLDMIKPFGEFSFNLSDTVNEQIKGNNMTVDGFAYNPVSERTIKATHAQFTSTPPLSDAESYTTLENIIKQVGMEAGIEPMGGKATNEGGKINNLIIIDLTCNVIHSEDEDKSRADRRATREAVKQLKRKAEAEPNPEPKPKRQQTGVTGGKRRTRRRRQKVVKTRKHRKTRKYRKTRKDSKTRKHRKTGKQRNNKKSAKR